MPFNQDDAREKAMVAALNLDQRSNRARHEEDAFLDIEHNGARVRLLFECKSAPENGDFGTGRDTGVIQLTRWSTMHFVFGWFAARGVDPIRMWYGSPNMMRAWIAAELDYLGPDQLLLGLVPKHLDATELVADVLGDKSEYSYEDLHRLMKAQWNNRRSDGRANLYKVLAKNPTASTHELRYDRAVAERAISERVAYLLARGSTVNNRKISQRYVQEHCIELTRPGWARDLDQAIHSEQKADLDQP